MKAKAKDKAKRDPSADSGQWIIAIRPGQLANGAFVKAGEIVQLGDDDVFSDRWMEKHEPPETQEPLPKKDAQAEADEAVRLHEETDKVRRGKFSIRSIPRSPEGAAAHLKRQKEEARARRARDEARRNPASPDFGVASGPAPYETSNRPSRVDENARRKAPAKRR